MTKEGDHKADIVDVPAASIDKEEEEESPCCCCPGTTECRQPTNEWTDD
jgi:hypothetical protein